MEAWKHQKEARELASSMKHFGLLWSPGTGKTRSVIDILRDVYTKNKKLLPTLILGPVIIIKNWKNEFAKYSKIDPDKILPLYGPTKKRIEQLEKARKKHGDGLIVVTNYEALVTSAPYFDALMDWNPRVVIADESHRIKNPSSKRTKQVIKIGDGAEYRYIMTGTPVLNSPMDIFSQFRFLDKGESFGKSFYAFRGQYFFDKNANMPKDRYFPDWVIRKESYDLMQKIILKKCTRVKKEEVLDLPPLLQIKMEVELSPEQKKHYTQMEKEFITFLEETEQSSVAQLAITKSLRMRQILSGILNLDDGTTHYLKETPRQAALKELLEDVTPSSKVIVWSVFIPEYKIIASICDKLGIKYVQANGEVSTKEKFAAVDTFNNDPEVRVFIGHPLSVGIGINLVASNYSIYMSRSFSLEERDQSLARNYRGGSEIHQKVTYVDLYTPNTVDEVILTSLDNKASVAEAILEWKKNKLQ